MHHNGYAVCTFPNLLNRSIITEYACLAFSIGGRGFGIMPWQTNLAQLSAHPQQK